MRARGIADAGHAHDWSSGGADAIRRGEAISRLLRRRGYGRIRRVLDVGCGEGGVTEALAATAELAVGTDLAVRLLRLGRSQDERRARVRFVAADATRLPFADGSFDLVVLYDVLEHVERWEDAVAEASRLLRPGGVAFVTAANTRSPITLLDDPHWHLPLVALLPPRLAERAVRWSGRASPDIEGLLPRFPPWRALLAAFRCARFRVRLVSNVEKLSDPDSVLDPSRRAFARSRVGRTIAGLLASGPGRPLLASYDRILARSWTFLLEKEE